MSRSHVACVLGALVLLTSCPLGGLERADALCTNVTCDTPPPPVCVEPGRLRHASPAGQCQLETGLCDYPFVETPCPLGCFDSERCRREGDVLARAPFVDAWALAPSGDALLVDRVPAPGCDAGVYTGRPMTSLGLEGPTAWQTGCAHAPYFEAPRPVWPMLTRAGVVAGFEGKQSYQAYFGSLWLQGDDGGVPVVPRPGRPSLALDDDDGIFWSAFDVAVALAPDGTTRWERPCPGACGSHSEGTPGRAMVVPGRAYVACRSGCTAFSPDGELLFERPAGLGTTTALLFTDSPDRALVGTEQRGLEALSWSGIDGGEPRFYPVTPPERLWVIAGVVEQQGTVLFAWNGTISEGGRILSEKYYLSRLEGPGLVEQKRVEVACGPRGGLAARRDGSVLVAVWCKDESPEPGPAIWVYDEQLELTARLPIPEYTLYLGPLSIAEDGTIWLFTNNDTVLVLTGTQPPAESPWPLVWGDAQNSRRARFRP